MARVQVITVPGCHLCELAVAVVAEVCVARSVAWAEQDLFALTDDEVRRWRDLVPVIVVDDQVLDTLHVDRARLLSAIG